ncbi:MAG: hypothetical protein LVQ96_04470 [Thermoplasmatales archaeon]|nr:hypothetical protein [Thermoplasmatales archaeon]MCW6170409.1 hypothetical protein [Thermoplasmatales archaeon]
MRKSVPNLSGAYQIQYYMGNPEELLRIRESKIEKARILRRERNMTERKGGETAGTVS